MESETGIKVGDRVKVKETALADLPPWQREELKDVPLKVLKVINGWAKTRSPINNHITAGGRLDLFKKIG